MTKHIHPCGTGTSAARKCTQNARRRTYYRGRQSMGFHAHRVSRSMSELDNTYIEYHGSRRLAEGSYRPRETTRTNARGYYVSNASGNPGLQRTLGASTTFLSL
jgi:hypothetical protein